MLCMKDVTYIWKKKQCMKVTDILFWTCLGMLLVVLLPVCLLIEVLCLIFQTNRKKRLH